MSTYVSSYRLGRELSGVAIWSPDDSKLAVARDVVDSDSGHLIPRLAVMSRATGDLTDVTGPKEGGVIPLFWTDAGIYVRTMKVPGDLLRCDPTGSGCVEVYSPGEGKMVLQATHIANDKALLVVKDFTVDPLEARGKEIHEVNLTTGAGHVFVRAPDGVFISDLHWAAEPSSSLP